MLLCTTLFHLVIARWTALVLCQPLIDTAHMKVMATREFLQVISLDEISKDQYDDFVDHTKQ